MYRYGRFVLLALFLLGGQCRSGEWNASEPTSSASVPPSAHYREFEDAADLASYLRADSEASRLVGAHRGGPEPGYPENALATFSEALEHGPVLIECDVRMTQDSVLILMHDETLDRTTTGQGSVRRHTLAEIRALRLVDGEGETTPFRVPTVAEALAWAEGRTILELDVKDGVPRPEVLDVLRRMRGFDQALVITYTMEDALWYHERAPHLVLSVSAETPAQARQYLQRIGPSRLLAFAGVGVPPARTIEVLRSRRVRVAVGTFGELDERARREGPGVYDHLFRRGIGLVATDEVPVAARAAYSEEVPAETP